MTQKKSFSRGLNVPLESKDIKNLLYQFYKREVELRKNEFRFTDYLKAEISEVGDFLTIEERKYGLFIPGNVGNGKTTMMKALKNMFSYLIDRGKMKYYEGDKYPRFVKASDVAGMLLEGRRTEYNELVSTKYLFLDDVGEEPTEVVAFGMPLRPLYKIIDYRYEHLLPTFISSNLSAEDICVKYDDERLSDRMYEMFKVLSFKGESFR